MKPEFKEFPKIARLSRECLITEKIDGSNASIHITEEGEFFTGSRTRWITPEEDNYGFSKWAHCHKEELIRLGVGTHFGEWWGGGIQRGYGLKKDDKRFWLFNVERWCLYGKEPQQIQNGDPKIVKIQDVLPPCVGLVPLLYRGVFATQSATECLMYLKDNGSQAATGFNDPEGIVVYHIDGKVGFKKTIKKDEQPKGL